MAIWLLRFLSYEAPMLLLELQRMIHDEGLYWGHTICFSCDSLTLGTLPYLGNATNVQALQRLH